MESRTSQIQKLKSFLDFIKEPILAVLAALLISQFIISHTVVPSGSMQPTINPKDHVVINRLPFYYRNPKKGEIVIFRKGEENLIKRVIGEPGDIIDIVDQQVYVNGQLLEEDYLLKPNNTYPLTTPDITYPYTVPAEYYFVMGDNREDSMDSRYFGAISRETIFAVGGFRIYPFNAIGIVR